MSLPINFKNIYTMMSTVGGDRIHDAYTAVSSLLVNVTSHLVLCNINHLESEATEAEKERVFLLRRLAQHTGNQLGVFWYDKQISKAGMIARTMSVHNHCVGAGVRGEAGGYYAEWQLTIDDDYIIPYNTLRLLELASSLNDGTKCWVYGMFDVENYRAFEDWDDEVRDISDVLPFVQKKGMRCINNHLWKPREDLIGFKMPPNACGTTMIDSTVFTNAVMETLHQWPKGQRGYDKYLCEQAARVQWVYGSNAYHTDRTKSHVDGVLWTKDCFRDDNRMDGTKVGRIPSDIVGEKSRPTGSMSK